MYGCESWMVKKAECRRINAFELWCWRRLLSKSYSYYLTLQEIKAIAEAPKPFIDFSETKTAIEVEYDYSAIYNELELRLHKVLELVTKAEEECAI